MENLSLDQLCWSEFLDEASQLFHDLPRAKTVYPVTSRFSEFSSTSSSSSQPERNSLNRQVNESSPYILPELELHSDELERVKAAIIASHDLQVDGAKRGTITMLHETTSPVRGVMKAFRTGCGLAQKIATLARVTSGVGAVELLHTAHNLESCFLESERFLTEVYQHCLDEFGQQYINTLAGDHLSTNRLQALTINLMGQILDLQESLNAPNSFDLGSIPYLRRESERSCHDALDVLAKTREKCLREVRKNASTQASDKGGDVSTPDRDALTPNHQQPRNNDSVREAPPIPAKAASRRAQVQGNRHERGNTSLSQASVDDQLDHHPFPVTSGEISPSSSVGEPHAALSKYDAQAELNGRQLLAELLISRSHKKGHTSNESQENAAFTRPNPSLAPRPGSAPESMLNFGTPETIIRPGSAPQIHQEDEDDAISLPPLDVLPQEISLADMVSNVMRVPSQYGEDRFSFQSAESPEFNSTVEDKELPPLPLKMSKSMPRMSASGQDHNLPARRQKSRKDLRRIMEKNGDFQRPVTSSGRRTAEVPETPPPPYTQHLSLFPRPVPTQDIPPIPVRMRPQRKSPHGSTSSIPPSHRSTPSSTPSLTSSMSKRSTRAIPRSQPEEFPPFDASLMELLRQQTLSDRPPTRDSDTTPPALQRRRTNSSDLGFSPTAGLPISPPNSEGRRSAGEEDLQPPPLRIPSFGRPVVAHEIHPNEHGQGHGSKIPERMSITPSMPTPTSSFQSIDLTLRHDNEFFQMGGFCEGGQMLMRGDKDYYKVIKRPAGQYTSTQAAKCAKCSFELGWQIFEKDLKTPLDKTGIYSTGEATVRYRASFLVKSHVHTKSSDQAAYACLFCYEENRTLEEHDATVFFSVAQLMHHIARHARPVRRVYGLKVAYNEQESATDYDFDLFFTNMVSSPDPMADVKPKISNRPKAFAVVTHRPRHPKFQERDPERQPTLQFASGAKIVGITFPSRFNGQWCGGYHDGQKALFPASCIVLEKPSNEDVVMNPRSTLTATARWDFKPSSKDSAWLSFSKKERITSISYPYADHWCYFGQNSKGKFGLFPAAFVEGIVDECGLTLNPRASMGSSAFSVKQEKSTGVLAGLGIGGEKTSSSRGFSLGGLPLKLGRGN